MGSLPIGVVLAGGHGRRLGGTKATVELCGRPLISYPLAALAEVLDEVVVVAKEATELPSLAGTTVWIEREPRQHPVIGLLEALALAGGRSVVVCALDLPLVTPELIRRLVSTPFGSGPAVVASRGDVIQPLLGRYGADAVEPLRSAGLGVPLREAVMALEPRLLEVADSELLLNVNDAGDLERARAALSRRSRTSSASAE
jgi:molybdopterin-guanine dinucleotide biosynthesis protein A